MQSITLSDIFSWRITSRYNKDVVFLLTGERGSGKSVSSIYIAYKTGEKIAAKKGGTWQDYFSMENVAIIDPRELMEKMQVLKPFNIYILDDAVGWSARSFMTKQNKMLNHILETCRTQNAGIFITTPDLFLIDKIPRSLASFVGEVAESHHDKGYNLLKVFRTERLRREGKTLYSHLQFYTPQGKSKIIRWRTHMPPEELLEEYNEIREKRAREMMHTAIEEPEDVRKGKVAQKWRKLAEEYGGRIAELSDLGKSIKEISQVTGLSEYYVKNIRELAVIGVN